MTQHNPPRLLLASASPRRSELLATLGVSFDVRAANIDEAVRSGESPRAYVQRMARDKAAALVSRVEGRAAVLAADTTVVADGRILGKPADRAESRLMLGLLSGREHQVYTAVALALDGTLNEHLAVTAVQFRHLSATEIDAYWDTREPEDKAGGYAIQGLGAVFVREIRGSYSGVVGLPLYETAELLTAAGFRLILGGHD